jgi:hypothetical protein
MVNFNKRILNTDKFRTPCISFQKHGVYCFAPSGTTEYFEYWNTEQERCINGFTAPDGDYISGYNYFYLNYCPILRLVEYEYKDRFGDIKKRREKTREFPDFYDYDYYYFSAIQEAEDEGKHMVVLKKRGAGYEQPYSEMVLTPNGYVEMGSLGVGDWVMNPNGSPIRVGEIVEQGEKDVYEVRLQDGRSVTCGENHLWTTYYKNKIHILTTKEYSERKLKQGKLGKVSYRYKLPEINPVKFDSRDELLINPYILGVLIGDGGLTRSSIYFYTDDDFILDELQRILGSEYDVKRCNNEKFKCIIKSNSNKNELIKTVKEYGLNVHSFDKFIPDDYKYASIEDRFSLIQGLMDTDGSSTSGFYSNGSCSFVSTSERLVDDFLFIARSLGIRCRKSNKISGRSNVNFGNNNFSNTRDSWAITITTDKNIFRLPRKLKNIRSRKNNLNRIAITEIVKLDRVEKQRCICVDNENHMYLTKDFIPTHNSFKGASMLARNYYHIENSKSYAIAAETEFLVRDGLLSKAWDLMDFIDEHTAWSKKRTVTTKMHRKSGIKVKDELGNETEIGYKSEIIGVTLKNDPNRARGKRGKLILWEEAGSFKDILQAWQIARPSVEEDGVAYGLMIAFGTGGDEGSRFDGLKELFYKPSGYNIKSFSNIWDEGADGNYCGFFVPVYANMSVLNEKGARMYMDKFGNSLREKATEYAMSERQKVIDGASDSRAIDRYIAENPITPQEAVLELTGNIFPKKELMMQLAALRTNKKLQNHKQVGDLNWVNGSLSWQIKKGGDITNYPLHRDDRHEGSIVIWEHPNTDTSNQLYIAGCDPYDHDKAGTNSLGSTFIYKRFQNFEEYYDILVAEYTGRPDTAEDYYENVRKLLMYYNARLLYENERKGIFPYFTQKHCDYLLADQPDIINDIIGKSTVQRRKGIHMNVPIKDYGEGLIKEYLNEEFAPGKKCLTTIFSEPLLEELIQYNDKGNFDRVIAMMMVLIYKQQLHNMHVKKKNQDSKKMQLFDMPLFSKEYYGSSSSLEDLGDKSINFTWN